MKARSVLTFAAPLVAAALAYQVGPGSTLDVGSILDGPFISGFHGRELTGGYSYRWTQASARTTISGLPSLARVEISARLSGFRPSGNPTSFSASLDQHVVTLSASQDMTTVVLGSGKTDLLGTITLDLQTDTFTTPSDPRQMGLKVDWIKAQPVSGPYLPSLPIVGVLAALGFCWLSSKRGWASWAYLGISAACLAWVLLGFPVAALAMGTAGTALGGAVAVAVHRDKIERLLVSLDTDRVASRILLLGLLIWACFSLWVVLHADFIGHADYADNAVVARNLVLGRGFVTDYVAQFYRKYADLSHPADTWPPLQPILIAASFAVFGIWTWSAKLPNLLAMVALGLVVYRLGRRVSSPAYALVAVAIVLTHDYLFSGVVYPLNDVVFTLLATLFFQGCWSVLGQGTLTMATALRQGALLGLMALAKPSGLLFAASLLVPMAIQVRRKRMAWQAWGLLGLTAMIVYLPWMAYSVVTFGYPFYSTEAHDAFVIRYRPPWENIYRLYWDNPPGLREFLAAGWDQWLQTTWDELRNLWYTFSMGKVLPPALLTVAVGGIFTLRGWPARLVLVTLPGFIAYTAFIVGYWHVETRYFIPLVPLLAILAAYFLKQLTRVTARSIALLMAPAALVLTIYFQGGEIVADSVKYYTSRTAIVEAADWSKVNLPADAVVMTRNPWEFSFHAERRSVMIPSGNASDAAVVAAGYGARYLQLDHLSSPIRPFLAPLYKGMEPKGFRLLYRNADVLIYVFDETGLAAMRAGRLE